MELYYHISRDHFKETNALEKSNLTIYRSISDIDEQKFLNKYALPNDVFYFDDLKPVAPRYENIKNKMLGETIIVVLSNIDPSNTQPQIEELLESHVFVLGENQLFWFIKDKHSHFDQDLIKNHDRNIDSIQSLVMYAILLSYTNFTEELLVQKERIDYFNKQAGKQTSNQILTQITDTERNLVILEHTISTQEQAIRYLLKDETFLLKIGNEMLIHDVKWYNRQVTNLVHVYRDLFDAVSRLYSDIVSNNLNLLLKFLSSLSIILAATGLIAELWGMNTGGLPFENHPYGTFIMIFIAIIVGLLMYLFLKRKKYFDD